MSKPNPTAAGGPLALIILACALIGAILGQPSLGVVIGVGLGAAIAIALWLIERNKIGE